MEMLVSGPPPPSAKLYIFGGNIESTNLILSANYPNKYRWRFKTIGRGQILDMDLTVSNFSDIEETSLKLTHSGSGRPKFQLYNNAIVANNGNVEIGIDEPDAKLDIFGGSLESTT